MHLKYLFLLIICFVFSNNVNAQKTIDLDKMKNIESLFNKCDFQFIALNENPGSFITQIDEIFLVEQDFVIFDKLQSKIFRFRENGKFINQIGSRGIGPESYTSAEDIAIDYQLNEVIILSNSDYKLNTYKLNGLFESSVKLDFPPTAIAAHEGYILTFNDYFSNGRYNNYWLNKKGKILQENFSYPRLKQELGFSFSGGLTNNYSKGILYADMLSPRIYELHPESSTLKYIIELGSDSWPNDKRYDVLEFLNNFENFNTPLSLIGNKFFESSDVFVFDYQKNYKVKKAFYDFRNNDLYGFKTTPKDGLAFVIFLMNTVGVTKEKILFHLDQDSIDYIREDVNEKDLPSGLSAILKDNREVGNIIVLAKFN